MPGLPSSHRARVRLAWSSVAAALACTVAGLIVFLPNTGHVDVTPIDRNARAVVITTPKTVEASSATRAAAERTLAAFVPSAIARLDPAVSWPLATAHMRVGTTRAQWARGDLPVVPYPAAAFRTYGVTLKYSYAGVLGYDVLVLPRETPAGDQAGQQVYSCELHARRGRWLVDFCYPRKTL